MAKALAGDLSVFIVARNEDKVNTHFFPYTSLTHRNLKGI